MIKKLEELRDRLKAATGADCKIDDDIATLILGWRYVEKYSHDDEGERVLDIAEWRDEKDQYAMCPDAYTASLDAAVALAERVLPGWQCVIAGPWVYAQHYEKAGQKVWDAGIVDGDNSYQDLIDDDLSNGATPALALCLAIVRALIVKEQG